MNQNNPFEQGPPTRPVIITIFAILTIVASAFAVLTGLFGEALAQAINPASPEQETWVQIATVVLSLVKIAGAIFILRMQKIGVILYTVGEVILVIIGFLGIDKAREALEIQAYNDPNIPEGMMEGIFFVSLAMSVIFSILWIAVYWYHSGKMN